MKKASPKNAIEIMQSLSSLKIDRSKTSTTKRRRRRQSMLRVRDGRHMINLTCLVPRESASIIDQWGLEISATRADIIRFALELFAEKFGLPCPEGIWNVEPARTSNLKKMKVSKTSA
jgi:hypothetical protein